MQIKYDKQSNTYFPVLNYVTIYLKIYNTCITYLRKALHEFAYDFFLSFITKHEHTKNLLYSYNVVLGSTMLLQVMHCLKNCLVFTLKWGFISKWFYLGREERISKTRNLWTLSTFLFIYLFLSLRYEQETQDIFKRGRGKFHIWKFESFWASFSTLLNRFHLRLADGE